MKMAKIRFAVSGFLAVFAWAAIGIAADHPKKPIRMIVPWSAGGGTDVLCRVFQPAFEKKATKDPEFIKIAQDELLYAVAYKPPEQMREELRKFDKDFGTPLTEMYK